MTECCDQPSSHQYPKKYRCPVNGKEYGKVALKTILHNINNPWTANLTDQGYYFCTDPSCQVVYFGQDGAVISNSQMRTDVWQKHSRPDSVVCYCFGVTLQQTHAQAIRNFVVEKTKESMCACEITNPSGRCCLKDFPKT
ncbi:putative iron-sulfur cluster-binding metallochaperone [Kaarinaea lacus]